MARLGLARRIRRGALSLTPMVAACCISPVDALETDVMTVTVQSQQPTVYLAGGHNHGGAVVCVLDGRTLTICPITGDGLARVVPLPSGTSVFDVVPGPTRDSTRLVAIVEDQVRAADVIDPGNSIEWSVLFERRTVFTSVSGPPRLYPLLFERADDEVMFLPTADGLVVVSLAGEELSRYDVSDETRYRVTHVSPPPGLHPVEPGSGLVIGINASIQYNFEVPGAAPRDSLTPHARPGTLQQMRDVADRQPRFWPWFALKTGELDAGRVFYSLAPPNYEDTSIAIQLLPNTETQPNSPVGTVGTPRRYPGIALPPREGLPDFNADGYSDLITWSAPRPGTSVASITRLLRGRTWPVSLQVFVYEPRQGFYAGRPAGRIRTRVPITDFGHRWSGSPFQHLFLVDCNGDNRTDVLLTPTDNRLALWIYEDGFAERPTTVQAFPSAIDSIPLPPTRVGERTIVVVQAGKTVYVLGFSSAQK